MTRIGLLGDPHATAQPVREALGIFAARGVDETWCTGDIAGYGDELDETVALLEGGSVTAVAGNHDAWYLEEAPDTPVCATTRYLGALPAVRERCIGGTRLYMVHASPPCSDTEGIRLLDEAGRLVPELQRLWSERLRGFPHDLLLVGHTHQLYAERLGDTLVVNPGSTRFNHSCVILTLPGPDVEVFALCGKAPLRTWNWGMQRREPQGARS